MAQRSTRTGTPRKPVTTKIADDLRMQLETAAFANSRTLGSEIEHRLRASFAGQDRRTLISEEIRAALAEWDEALQGERHVDVPGQLYRY